MPMRLMDPISWTAESVDFADFALILTHGFPCFWGLPTHQ
jgi:hypothetical protein